MMQPAAVVSFDSIVSLLVARIGMHREVDTGAGGVVSTWWGDTYDGDGPSVYVTRSDDGVTIHARRRGDGYRMAWIVPAQGIAASVLDGTDPNSVTAETAVEIAAMAMGSV